MATDTNLGMQSTKIPARNYNASSNYVDHDTYIGLIMANADMCLKIFSKRSLLRWRLHMDVLSEAGPMQLTASSPNTKSPQTSLCKATQHIRHLKGFKSAKKKPN
jgi:hypothetical protein